MKEMLTLLFALFAIMNCLCAQLTDTLYYDYQGEASDKSHMAYYKFYTISKDEKTLTEKTFFSNHMLRSEIHYVNDDRFVKTDTAKAFYSDGAKNWIISYNPNGSTQSLKQYYSNGVIKRIEYYKNGKFVKGKKYNNRGRRIGFTRFQQAPKYNGGHQRMIDYLNRTIIYPAMAKELNISGIVHVSFIVSKEGEVLKPKIIKSVHPLLDKEAIRVVKIMKQWIPGKTDDQALNSRICIPITFGKPEADEHIPLAD